MTNRFDLWLERAAVITELTLIWAVSLYLFSSSTQGKTLELGDIAALMFGASSIALFILSMIVAFLALVGWKDIQDRLKHVDDLEKQVDIRLGKELSGRINSLTGVFLGEMSMDKQSFEVKDRDRMADAIEYSYQGYVLMKEVGGPGESMALNNLIFFSCLMLDRSKSSFLLAHGKRLGVEAREHNSTDVLLTSCLAIIVFTSDEKERSETRDILASIAADPRATEKQKKEARIYLAPPFSSSPLLAQG